MDCSTPGFPVLCYLPEFVQTHVHWVDDTIQPFHPLLPPSPPALNLSQYQGLKYRWLSGKESICQCRRWRRLKFDPWVGKIAWRRKWQPTPVFLSGESYGQRSLTVYSPWGCKELDTTLWLDMHSIKIYIYEKTAYRMGERFAIDVTDMGLISKISFLVSLPTSWKAWRQVLDTVIPPQVPLPLARH